MYKFYFFCFSFTIKIHWIHCTIYCSCKFLFLFSCRIICHSVRILRILWWIISCWNTKTCSTISYSICLLAWTWVTICYGICICIYWTTYWIINIVWKYNINLCASFCHFLWKILIQFTFTIYRYIFLFWQ